MSYLSTSYLPLNVPVIAQFNYMNDCQVKIPVSVREKDGHYFMKSPVRPNPEWNLNLIIRSIDFPTNHPIRLMKTPFGEMDLWDSHIVNKVGRSEFAEIYEIVEPKYLQMSSGRRTARIFCLAPVKCFIGDAHSPLKATCVDISETGLGLRFDVGNNFPIGEKARIIFDQPLDSLPELVGKIVRQSTSALDKSTSLGVILLPEYANQAQKILDFMAQRQAIQTADSYIGNFGGQEQSGLMSLSKSLPKDIMSLFSGER